MPKRRNIVAASFTTLKSAFEMNDIRLAAAAEVEFQRSSQTGAGQHLARLIAFYLPQFYPIPDNDAWWGPGFSEWTNVAKARPLYKGHKQPRLPADLGFYDLRLAETRERQANMARAAGIEGFCYWHYWFGGGRRILERVFDEVLATGKPNYPFCLAWANKSWSGIWHGMARNMSWSNKRTREQPISKLTFARSCPRSGIHAI